MSKPVLDVYDVAPVAAETACREVEAPSCLLESPRRPADVSSENRVTALLAASLARASLLRPVPGAWSFMEPDTSRTTRTLVGRVSAVQVSIDCLTESASRTARGIEV